MNTFPLTPTHCVLSTGLSECKWGFYGKSEEETHPEDKRGIITSVKQEDDVPSGERQLNRACTEECEYVLKLGLHTCMLICEQRCSAVA